MGSGDKLSAYMHYVSWFLLIWWAFGAGFMTFKSPFVATSNGYFGAWLALYAAFMLCQNQSETLRGWIGQVGAHGNLLVALTVASAAVLAQTLILTVDSHRFENEVVAWICSVTSLVICLLIVLLKVQDDVLKWIMLGMLALWSVGVGFLTFDGPYVVTSNAYFACWIALCVSKTFVLRLFPDVVPRSAPVTESQPSASTGPVAKVVGAALEIV
jgi:cytochrome bd-type quinol oxidase subunit 2